MAHGGFVGWVAMSCGGGGGFLCDSDDVGVYFPEHFSKCNQTLENKTFFLKSFTFENIS